jgi:ABC-type glutathione transport system ATPase component
MKTPGRPDAQSLPSTEVVATLQDVIVTFDSFASRAVNAVNMQIKRGEVVGLVGLKQSGKSTILGSRTEPQTLNDQGFPCFRFFLSAL